MLRGHLGEVVSCSVSSDLGLIASSSDACGVLLHSLRRGRLMRRLDVKGADAVRLSSQGVVLIWNQLEKTLSTFSVNGIPIATRMLSPFPGRISCIEICADGEYALLGTCSSIDDNLKVAISTEDCESRVEQPDAEKHGSHSYEASESVPVPSICFVDVHTLKVKYK